MAPVPFFMGIGSDVGLTKFEAEGIVVVDLDANEVRVPTNEAMPSLPDSKTKKLVNLLRKITASSPNWMPGSAPQQQTALPLQQAQQPSNQVTRSTFGALLNSQLGPLPSTYSPSQPTDGELMALAQAHDELTDKWAEIQGVFAAFATRLIKDVRKFCSRAASPERGTPPNRGSSCSIEFDTRGFLAVHQGMRDFCSHLFQTQLFQRFLDNFDAVTYEFTVCSCFTLYETHALLVAFFSTATSSTYQTPTRTGEECAPFRRCASIWQTQLLPPRPTTHWLSSRCGCSHACRSLHFDQQRWTAADPRTVEGSTQLGTKPWSEERGSPSCPEEAAACCLSYRRNRLRGRCQRARLGRRSIYPTRCSSQKTQVRQSW